jgi:hypothetical protein
MMISTTENGSYASAIVVVAAPTIHEAIAAGVAIPSDVPFGISDGRIMFGRDLTLLSMATGARDGFQLIVPNPDAEVVACIDRNIARWDNATCEPCEEGENTCHCQLSVDDEEFCGGQATVFQSMSSTLAVDVGTAAEALAAVKNTTIVDLFQVE